MGQTGRLPAPNSHLAPTLPRTPRQPGARRARRLLYLGLPANFIRGRGHLRCTCAETRAAPPRRFRRHRGHQGNRRQPLSSAVAGGTTGGREGRPSPISQRKRRVDLLPHRRPASVARVRPPPLSPGPLRGVACGDSASWPCSPGQNTTANCHCPPQKAAQPGTRLDSTHSGQDLSASRYLAPTPTPNPPPPKPKLAPAIDRDPGILSPQPANFLDTHPTPTRSRHTPL